MDKADKLLTAKRIRKSRLSIEPLLTMKAAGVLAGISGSTWANYETGAEAESADQYPDTGRTPDYTTIKKMAKVLGVTASYLAGFSDTPNDKPSDWQHIIADGIDPLDRQIANNGLAFHNDLLSEKGINGREALLIKVTDNSMAPTLESGGFVLIDQNSQGMENPGIFCIRDKSGKQWLRRIRQEMTGGYTIYAEDNTHHPDHQVTEAQLAEWDIVGRYAGHWHWSRG